MEKQRLNSLDIFRGLTVAGMLFVNNPGSWDHIFIQLDHSAWHGFTFADLIFPAFLFILGASLDLAFGKIKSLAHPYRFVILRGLKIFVLGVILHVIAMWLIPNREFRLLGVLQRIGVCYTVTALLLLYWGRTKQIALACGTLLLVGWGLLNFGGGFDINTNLADRIDTHVLGRLAWQFDSVTGLAREPEGILSTFNALVSCLLGVLAMRAIRKMSVTYFAFLSTITIVAAIGLNYFYPINKQLWTGSYALLAGGLSALIWALIKAWRDEKSWYFPGTSMGKQALSIYAISWILACLFIRLDWNSELYSNFLVLGLEPNWASFCVALSFTVGMMAIAKAMETRGLRFQI